MKSANAYVQKMIQNVKQYSNEYWQKALKQRLPGTGAGSVYTAFKTPEELEEALLSANWEYFGEDAENVIPGCPMDKIFKTEDIPSGIYGMAKIEELPEGTKLYAKDVKNTGFVSLLLEGKPEVEAKTTWMITGVRKGVERAVTFWPGELIPVIGYDTGICDGDVVSREEALAAGYIHAKYVENLAEKMNRA